MAAPSWHVSGKYFETCSCDFVCPCILGQMSVMPSKGSCTFAMSFQIERGEFSGVSLDGLSFVVIGMTPAEMGKGQWSVGVIADERATPEQRDAITGIASGQAGGPMAALSGLVGTFLGVESAPINFTSQPEGGWSVQAGSFLDMSAHPANGINPEATEPLALGNTGHPAADRVFLARASNSKLRAFGLTWEDSSGGNNGQFAPFSWQGA